MISKTGKASLDEDLIILLVRKRIGLGKGKGKGEKYG